MDQKVKYQKLTKGQGFGRSDDVNPFSKTGQEESKEDKYDKFSKLKV